MAYVYPCGQIDFVWIRVRTLRDGRMDAASYLEAISAILSQSSPGEGTDAVTASVHA